MKNIKCPFCDNALYTNLNYNEFKEFCCKRCYYLGNYYRFYLTFYKENLIRYVARFDNEDHLYSDKELNITDLNKIRCDFFINLNLEDIKNSIEEIRSKIINLSIFM